MDHELDATEQGRRAALCGRPIYANPHLGGDADAWFIGYREVPEAERGSRPELRRSSRVGRKSRKSPRPFGMAGAGVKALGDRCLPGSTPLSPFGEAICAEVEEARRAHAPKPISTPRPWSEL